MDRHPSTTAEDLIFDIALQYQHDPTLLRLLMDDGTRINSCDLIHDTVQPNESLHVVYEQVGGVAEDEDDEAEPKPEPGKVCFKVCDFLSAAEEAKLAYGSKDPVSGC